MNHDSFDDPPLPASPDAGLSARIAALPPSKKRVVMRLLDRLAELETGGPDAGPDVRSSLDLLQHLLSPERAVAPMSDFMPDMLQRYANAFLCTGDIPAGYL